MPGIGPFRRLIWFDKVKLNLVSTLTSLQFVFLPPGDLCRDPLRPLSPNAPIRSHILSPQRYLGADAKGP